MSRSGSSGREVGDYFPNILSSPFVSSDEGLPQDDLPQLSGPTRMATPRGCRFRDLDEAHRNITGRSVSNIATASRKTSSGADTAFSDEIPLQDLSSSRSSGARPQNMVDDRHGFPTQHLHGRSLTTPNWLLKTRAPSAGADDTDTRSPRPADSGPVPGSGSKGTTSLPSETSDNTVDRIYRQYQGGAPDFEGLAEATEEVGSQDDDGTLSRTAIPSIPPPIRDGAKNRCGFRPEEIGRQGYGDSDDLMPSSSSRDQEAGLEHNVSHAEAGGNSRADYNPNWIFPRASRLGEAPAASLPRLPGPRFAGQVPSASTHMLDLGTSLPPSSVSVSNTQELLNGVFVDDGDDGEDEPGFMRSQLDASVHHHNMYPMPLHVQSVKGKEKQLAYVSGAGASTAGMTTESDDDPFRYDKQSFSVFLQPSKEREVSAALRRVSGLSSHSKGTLCSPDGSPIRSSERPPPVPENAVALTGVSSPMQRAVTKRPEAGFYNSSALKTVQGEKDSPYDVKVTMKHGSTSNKDRVAHRGDGGGGGPPALTDRNLRLGQFYQAKNTIVSDGDDWETVATSGAGLGSAGLSLPAELLTGSNVVKLTGRHVDDDDVSDGNGSCYDVPFDDFASTDRMIQHPVSDDSGPSFCIRRVKGVDMPIFMPKQRVHRVNGFAQDSGRLFPPQGHRIDDAYPAEASGRSANPFRQISLKKRRLSPFAQATKSDKKSRFEIQNGGGGGVGEGSSASPGQIFEGGIHSRVSDGIGLTHEEESQESDDAESHAFTFDLIPLPEAARIQAIRRASGLDDQTETGSARARRAMSQASSKRSDISSLSAVGDAPRIPEPAYYSGHQPVLPSSSPPRPRRVRRRGKGKGKTGQFTIPSTSLSSTNTTRTFGETMFALDGSLGPRAGRYGDRPNRGIYQRTVTAGYQSPRLYTWEERRLYNPGDTSLRAIANVEAGLPVNADDFLSYEARSRRRAWFILMLAISIFPFMSILVYRGKFDNALSWLTKGEVHRLSHRQQRVILTMMILQCITLPFLLFILIWHYRN